MTRDLSDLPNLRVLIVDDEPDLRLGLCLLLASTTTEIREAESGEEALQISTQWAPHVVLSDLQMGVMSGMELLRHFRERLPAVKFVMMTGFGTIEVAVEAMREGASSFLCKPFDNEEIRAQVERFGGEALFAERMSQLQASAVSRQVSIVAEDPKMAAVLELVRQVASTEMSVLIRGESGTGKELIARAIHQGSSDPTLPFLPVNSAALPDTLLESELFGHLKGAFTGADRAREGIFARARGGTVFLDEIASMSLAFQGKLLRALQEHTVTPLGSSTPQPVRFRLVAATHRRLRELVSQGSFREDLYYRLRVVTIDLPPLRERAESILPLALHFLAKYARAAGLEAGRTPALTKGAVEALTRHRWPGNVRELENCMQRALILSRGAEIGASHLNLEEESNPWPLQSVEALSYEDGKQRVLEVYRRRVVARALRASRGNVTQAAEMCDLTRAAFQRLMRQLELDRSEFSRES